MFIPASLLVAQLVAAGPTGPVTCAADREDGDRGEAPACALSALRIAESAAPTLDGRLDEEAWRRASFATGFEQFEPDPGAAASLRTEARVLYTADAVYVGMRLFDTDPDSIRAQFVGRDDHEALSDWAHVMLDTYHDRRTAFEFATTPRGARVDILHLDDTETDPAWDAVWEVATSIDAEGWTAEFRIPLSQLRFAEGEDLRWGINFGRKVARRSEVAYWAPLPPNAGRGVSLYGELEGLTEMGAPGGLELLPYTVGRLRRAPGDELDPFYDSNDLWGSVGVDFKYGLTSNLTLTGTMNPDFGQVEADPSEVNLTAFETFYEEKRPFFTEGTEIFDFRLLPEGYAFYSRRIGRPPQIRPTVSSGGFVDARETAPILGALKLTGKTAGGWSVGLMTSVTGKVDAEIRTPTATSVQAIEPLTTYSAGRVSRDFRDGASGLGVLATATNRRLDDLSRERLHSGAYSAAFDWWHRFGSNQDIEFDGWLIGTHVRGSESALARTQRTAQHLFTRPDADHVTYDPTRTSLNGWAGEAGLGKTGGNWTWNLGTGTRSPGVEVNDLGFLSYGDLWYLSTSLKYSEFEAGRLLRNWYLEGRFVPAWTYGGERIRESFHVNARATLLNFWQAETQIERWGWHLWPWELRGGPALRIPGFTDVRWILRSDSRKSWSVRLQGNVRRDDQGGSREYVFDPKIDFRPTARATVSLGPVLRIDRDADQYVARASASGGDEYVVGRLEQTTAILEARVSYGFSPTLTLDLFAQPFVSNGSYDRFRTVANPTEADFEARLPLIQGLVSDPVQGTYTTPEFSFSDPDFNVREFRLNAVLRWEYRPGSTLFLVWTQAREDGLVVGDFDLGRDVDRLFASPATNVFMVKMNYWLGF